jgi:hypothetical protein
VDPQVVPHVDHRVVDPQQVVPHVDPHLCSLREVNARSVRGVRGEPHLTGHRRQIDSSSTVARTKFDSFSHSSLAE